MHPLLTWSFLLSISVTWTTAFPIFNHTFIERRAAGTFVSSLSQCPSLPRRSSPPTSVHDLRPDDFAYTMALGDSITAGTFLRGIQDLTINDITEWRGQSYAAGMDEGAITVPNLIKHYNPSVTGGSKGSNLIGPAELCLGPVCIEWPFGIGWHSSVDQLNAARSGASALNLPYEVDTYLIPQVSRWNIPRNKFKYLNLQIGSNELCYSCLPATIGLGTATPEMFEANIERTLNTIRNAIPNTLVNVIGVFKVSPIHKLTRDEPYCKKRLPSVLRDLPRPNLECPCALLEGPPGEALRASMDNLAEQYNQSLIKVIKKFQQAKYSDFAVIWQPPIVDLENYPIEALSDVDCHHPSLKTHKLIATGVWNRMVASKEEKAAPVSWTTAPEVRCLQENDRILTKTLL